MGKVNNTPLEFAESVQLKKGRVFYPSLRGNCHQGLPKGRGRNSKKTSGYIVSKTESIEAGLN